MISIAPGSVAAVVLQVPGIAPGDLVTVDNPAAGYLITQVSTGAGSVTIRLYNVSSQPTTVSNNSQWTITWADLTP